MMLTGKPISGTEAYTFGLVNRVVKEEHLIEEARTLAEFIAEKSKGAIQEIMKLVLISKTEPLSIGMKEEAESFKKVFATEDAKEGIQAFIEKRKPHFQDK
jgi:enoyl-CoA hydratase